MRFCSCLVLPDKFDWVKEALSGLSWSGDFEHLLDRFFAVSVTILDFGVTPRLAFGLEGLFWVAYCWQGRKTELNLTA